jgi:hypothetical protein
VGATEGVAGGTGVGEGETGVAVGGGGVDAMEVAAGGTGVGEGETGVAVGGGGVDVNTGAVQPLKDMMTHATQMCCSSLRFMPASICQFQ